MRARIAPSLLVSALMLPGAALGASHTRPPLSSERCPGAGPHLVDGRGKAGAFKRLDQLPPAAEILPVLRVQDGCERPIVVRYGIGGNPAAAPKGNAR